MVSIHAIFLALVQSITEFLPVSSSGHLVIVSEWWGGIAQPLWFDVALHGATLLAVVVYFRKEVREMIVGTIHGDRTHRSRASALLIATLPIVVVGPLVYQYVDTVFRSADIVAYLLIGSAIVVLVADAVSRRVAAKHLSAGAPPLRHGLLIGFFQVLAVLPGVSRSGITMAAGRLAGFSRPFAARFSFLLSIPTIAAALVFTGMKAATDAVVLSAAEAGVLIVALAIAFAVAYAVIHYFLKIIARIGFAPFCAYQISLGVLVLLLLA